MEQQQRDTAGAHRRPNHRRPGRSLPLALVALVALLAASAADAARLERLMLRAGPTIPGNDPGGAGGIDLAIGIEPERPPGWLRPLGGRLSFELSGGWLVNADPPSDEVSVGRAGVVWRYHPGFMAEHQFIEAGPGIAFRSEEHINGLDQGTQALFSIQATVGTHFGPERRRRLALRWQHTSNAGTGTPNPGINLLMLETGYRWGAAPASGSL